jgi:hypothetical protein
MESLCSTGHTAASYPDTDIVGVFYFLLLPCFFSEVLSVLDETKELRMPIFIAVMSAAFLAASIVPIFNLVLWGTISERTISLSCQIFVLAFMATLVCRLLYSEIRAGSPPPSGFAAYIGLSAWLFYFGGLTLIFPDESFLPLIAIAAIMAFFLFVSALIEAFLEPHIRLKWTRRA